MINNDVKYMEITDQNNHIVKYRILTSFIWGKTGKRYVIYTDDSYNENKELKVYASIYNPFDNTKLEKITKSSISLKY